MITNQSENINVDVNLTLVRQIIEEAYNSKLFYSIDEVVGCARLSLINSGLMVTDGTITEILDDIITPPTQ